MKIYCLFKGFADGDEFNCFELIEIFNNLRAALEQTPKDLKSLGLTNREAVPPFSFHHPEKDVYLIEEIETKG